MLIRPGRPGVPGHLAGVDRVQRDALGQDLLLDRAGQAVPHLLGWVRAVQQQRRAGRSPAQHVGALDQLGLVAADEAGVQYEIGGVDRAGSEAQVGNRLGAGFLGVVDEVALGVQAAVRAEDLDGVLVRADRAVRAEAVEHRADRAGRLDVQLGVVQAGAADVVGDADGEPRLRVRGGQVGEDAGHHARGELLGGQAIPAAGDHRHGAQAARRVRFGQRAEHIQEQRLAQRPRLLGPVQHGHPAHRAGQRGEQVRGGERAEQPHRHDAYLLAPAGQVAGGLGGGLRARPHDHDDPFGGRVAGVARPGDTGGRSGRPARPWPR